MRIVHISDIHIRNFKYRREYMETFYEFFDRMEELRPDLIINTGDYVHSKTQISPELVDILTWHIKTTAQLAPYRIILGNHDLNLKNTDRQDAISPVVGTLKEFCDVELWKKNGRHVVRHPGFNFWVFSIKDEDKYPTRHDWGAFEDIPRLVNIGLFHGSIKGCSTDMDWVMDDVEYDTEMFSGLDYVMMGDIHRHQSWNGGRIAYAGSLIQQNFGESPDKGFLVWDIEDKERFTVTHHQLKTPLRFCTVQVGIDMNVPERDDIPEGAYLKVIVDSSFTPTEQRVIADQARTMYRPADLFVVGATGGSLGDSVDLLSEGEEAIEFHTQESQERLLTEFLRAQDLDDETVAQVLAVDRDVSKDVASDDDTATGAHWRINKIGWSNMFQYGEGNIVDLDKVRGVHGIFGQNGMGKSSFFETITEGLFDRVTKDAPRNIDLVNDDRDEGRIIIDITVDGRDYVIERTISRLKYGQRKKDVKEWGKTSLDFYGISPDGERTLLNGASRPETEKTIRHLIGTFEDFCLTSMTPQITVQGLPGGGDFINCKDTDRKKLLYRFLGLDIFDKKLAAAKEKSRDLFTELKALQRDVPDVDEIDRKVCLKQSGIGDVRSSHEKLIAEYELSREVISSTRAKVELLQGKVGVARPYSQVADDMAKLRNEYHQLDGLLLQLDHEAVRFDAEIEMTVSEIGALGPVTDPNRDIIELEREISSVELTQGKLHERMKSAVKKLKILEEVPCGDHFPDCKFLRDAFEARTQSPSMITEDGELSVIIHDLKVKRLMLESSLTQWKKFTELNSKLSKLTERKNTFRESLSEIRMKQAKIQSRLRELEKEGEESLRVEAAIEELAELRPILSDAERKFKSLGGRITSSEQSLREYERELAGLEERLRSARERVKVIQDLTMLCRVYEIYMEAVGKNGVPRSILRSVLPEISREVNRAVTAVSTMTVSLDADDDDQSLSLTVTYEDGKTRPVALAGGAQKFIISLAIRAALSRITGLPRSNMFIVDEGFGRLDPENIQAIQRMFQFLRGLFDHIIIVSHTEVMRDMVDGTIDIGVDPAGMAHIEHI